MAVAARGQKVTGLEIFQRMTDDITAARAEELVSEMNADKTTGGTDMAYGNRDAQRLCFWKAKLSKALIVLFVHGGSWRPGKFGPHWVSQSWSFDRRGLCLCYHQLYAHPLRDREEQVQEVPSRWTTWSRKQPYLTLIPNRSF